MEEKWLVIVSYTYVQTHFVLSDFHTVGKLKVFSPEKNLERKNTGLSNVSLHSKQVGVNVKWLSSIASHPGFQPILWTLVIRGAFFSHCLTSQNIFLSKIWKISWLEETKTINNKSAQTFIPSPAALLPARLFLKWFINKVGMDMVPDMNLSLTEYLFYLRNSA